MNKIIILLFSTYCSYAQTYPFGKVSKELLMLSECSTEKNANAMVTYKSGVRDVNYTDTDGFITSIKYKKQIKIFNNDAKDVGTISFFFYSPKTSSSKYTLSDIKGQTYNLDGDKIVETPINQENVHKVQFNKFYKRATITMPELRKGSVLEFEYILSANNMTNIDDYQVQEDVPVLYNKFEIVTPEYFNFQINLTGSIQPEVDKKDTRSKTINYKTYYEAENKIMGRKYEYHKFEMPFNTREFIFQNVPSYIPEPYTIYPESSIGLISHQLISIEMPREPLQIIATSYEKLNEDLIKDSDFGGRIKKGDFIEDFLDYKSINDTLLKAEAIYNYFTKNVTYDGYNGYYTTKSGANLFKDAKGDSGDININYIAALNHAGIETYPIVLRTLGDGIMHPIYPNYSHINYVIAVSIVKGKDYYSDATSGLPFGALPMRCLNGDGWLVEANGGGWMPLNKNTVGKQVVQTKIAKSGNKLLYLTKLNRGQTFAFEDNAKIQASNKEELLKTWRKRESISTDSADIVSMAPEIVKYKFANSQVIEDEATIFIEPFVFRPLDINPFMSETRIAPISFIYNKDYKMSTTIEIPSGYTYEPIQNENLSLEGDEIEFKYNSSFNATTNFLTINADFKINQANIGPDKYSGIKAIFEKMFEKLGETVVLKKL